jgi:ectoine hydroxylase-related dioxygenase (phytanoyl-CoA dioxygenase family)
MLTGMDTGVVRPKDRADAAHTFARDGAVVVRDVLTAEHLSMLAAGVERNLARPGPWASEYTPAGRPGRFFDDYVNWTRIDEFRELALSGPLARLATELIGGGPVRFFHEHVLVKEPGTDEVTPWHHDDPYYCVDGVDNVSLWVPLDPVPAEAGLEFVAGSHRWGRRFIPRRFVDHQPYAAEELGFEHVPDIDAERDSHRIIRFDADPGDVVAFHFRELHAAPGTVGRTSRRRAVSFRYVGDGARFAVRPWRHSPPFDEIRPGESLDDARFPVVRVDAH